MGYTDSLGILKSFKSSDKVIFYYSLPELEKKGLGKISTLPFSIRVVLESLARNLDGKIITERDVRLLANWGAELPEDFDIPFKVSRILMQDFTGVPAVVDLVAMRDFIVKSGASADTIQPQVPVDLIIDHSVQVDSFNTVDAIGINQQKEVERNRERYHLLKWAASAFDKFKVYPPSAGICHQINLEYLAKCVSVEEMDGKMYAYPDTLVGTDSHTTMINGLGVVGYGVGGIEAEAAMLGQPVAFTTPKVLGVHITGKMKEGVTATDFALTLTRILRDKGVVGMFVEFFGEGLNSLSLPDRATLSNMCPEYGATIAIFPPDEKTLEYMRMTGRSAEQVDLVRDYYMEQGIFGIDYKKIAYSDKMEVDLDAIEPSVSGPDQPKEQIRLRDIMNDFDSVFINDGGEKERLRGIDATRWATESSMPDGGNVKDAPTHSSIKSFRIKDSGGYEYVLSDGDVVISSITSCTNTSNPSVMIAAGLLAKKAVEAGLKVDTKKVKTSLGPGSRVVTEYLQKAGLLEYLDKLGYGLVGYGCITCIGNSGPLIDGQSEIINKNNLAVASVLSGNRNYEARIHRDIRANYLMSPPLVIAFGIAGTVRINMDKDPLGNSKDGNPVYLKDIWPSGSEIEEVVHKVVSRDMFEKIYGKDIYNVNNYWNGIETADGTVYSWQRDSTYIRLPPFFDSVKARELGPLKDCVVLAVFGDSLSTDHISPAGAIGVDSPAGKYLVMAGVAPHDFNTYGSRRGNHEVMMRGTFANNRIKNILMGGEAGGCTVHFPDMRKMSIYDAAMEYKNHDKGIIVFGGREYGSGSSRDWAAKGPALIGVRAVIAQSFERIHRSNLVGMGVIPLQFKNGESYSSIGIDPSKPVDIEIEKNAAPRDTVKMCFYDKAGARKDCELLLRIDTETELNYCKAGGILNYVLGRIISGEL